MTKKTWTFVIIGTVAIITLMLVNVDVTINSSRLQPLQDKRIKCVDGELWQELKPHIFIKSHLQCFEEGKFNSR